jgi:hypothetical protein
MVQIVDVEEARYESDPLEERHDTEPMHICDTRKSPLIYYIAYNGRHLTGLIIGYDATTSGTQVDLVIFTNMSNVNGVKNFGQQFHADVPYSEIPVPGTWHWIEF